MAISCIDRIMHRISSDEPNPAYFSITSMTRSKSLVYYQGGQFEKSYSRVILFSLLRYLIHESKHHICKSQTCMRPSYIAVSESLSYFEAYGRSLHVQVLPSDLATSSVLLTSQYFLFTSHSAHYQWKSKGVPEGLNVFYKLLRHHLLHHQFHL